MIRKQLYITEKQQELISELVKETGLRESEIIRKILDLGIEILNEKEKK
jgi:hypothetical protein